MPLVFENVSFVYDGAGDRTVNALNDINLKIESGVFYGLIGHTGSGKSTLVQHMNGLLHPTSGRVLLDGTDLADKSVNMRSIRSKVGLVFQYPEHQLFEITVYDDVCFGPKNMGLSAEEIKDRATEALKQVGLDEELWKQSPFELSGGQRRRAAIAGVLAMRPDILVLDEPTAGLDPGGRDEILDQIRLLHEKEGMTVVLVSHSMEDVAKYADRIVVMNKGRIVYEDTPMRVFEHTDELEDMGLSAPRVSYILKRFKENGWAIEKNAITIDEAADEIMHALDGKINA